jgi:hypothetical protein
MGKIWGVWCKGVQCSMMGELKQIKISSLISMWKIEILTNIYFKMEGNKHCELGQMYKIHFKHLFE